MLHEDPKVEKVYIKRLYKHKKYDMGKKFFDTDEMRETTNPKAKQINF